MKVGIVTVHNSNNCGSYLQAAALCEDQLLVAGMFLPAVMLTPRVSLAVCLDMWLNVILDASVRVFGDEINI